MVMSDPTVWSDILQQMAAQSAAQQTAQQSLPPVNQSTGQPAAQAPVSPPDFGKALQDVNIIPTMQGMINTLKSAQGQQQVQPQGPIAGPPPPTQVFGPEVSQAQPQQAPVQQQVSKPASPPAMGQQVAGPAPSPVTATQEPTLQSPPDMKQQVEQLKTTMPKDKEGKDKWYETLLNVANPLLQILGSAGSIYSMAKYGRYGMPQIGQSIGQVGGILGGVGKQLSTRRQQNDYINTFPEADRPRVRAAVRQGGIAAHQKSSADAQKVAADQDFRERKFDFEKGKFALQVADRNIELDEKAFNRVSKLQKTSADYIKQITGIQDKILKLLPEEEKKKYKDKTGLFDVKSWFKNSYTDYDKGLQGYKNSLGVLYDKVNQNEAAINQFTSSAPQTGDIKKVSLTPQQLKDNNVQVGQIIVKNGQQYEVVGVQ